jgi:benzoyl-CoA reductase subunit BamC
VGALTLAEREEEVADEGMKVGEMEIGLESLVKRFGIDKITDAVEQISKGTKR